MNEINQQDYKQRLKKSLFARTLRNEQNRRIIRREVNNNFRSTAERKKKRTKIWILFPLSYSGNENFFTEKKDLSRTFTI